MGFSDIFKIKEFKAEISRLQQENLTLISDNQNLQSAASQMRSQLNELGAFDYYKVKNMISELEADYKEKEKTMR